jgi:UDP-N-acetylglucosamine/UDP-N-acetylgalactosamine diphosphorylase
MIQVKDKSIQKKIEQIHDHDQGHIFRFWDILDDDCRMKLLDQVTSIDFDLLKELTGLVLDREKYQSDDLHLGPAEFISLDEREGKDEKALITGEDHIKAGKVAAFLVAGGQGTRLGFSGPKGMFPVTPVKNKSLFQHHAEKLLAVGHRYGVRIPWYIMTSQTNNDQTVQFFKENGYFGYDDKDIFFMIQDMIPAFDRNGHLILDAHHHIFMNPNGHGGSLKALWESGAIDDMKHRGIKDLFYFQVDNVLTNICDPVYMGYHVLANSDMSNKVVRKKYPEEKMGLLCKINGSLGLVEYSDLSKEKMYEKNSDGTLKYWAGNIATHILSIDFVERENMGGFKLPYHLAEKSIPYLDAQGNLIESEDKNGFKFETFIFDALLDVRKAVSIEVDRSKEFSPLKNNKGENSPETIRRDLNNTFGAWIEAAGYDVERDENNNVTIDIEISPLFALNKEILLTKKFVIDKEDKKIYLGP